MSLNFLGVLSVAGVCFIVKFIMKRKAAEKIKETISKREYRPTLQDRRLSDGGTVYVSNILGQPQEGSV